MLVTEWAPDTLRVDCVPVIDHLLQLSVELGLRDWVADRLVDRVPEGLMDGLTESVRLPVWLWLAVAGEGVKEVHEGVYGLPVGVGVIVVGVADLVKILAEADWDNEPLKLPVDE